MNLHDTPNTEIQKAIWYKTIHDILETNVRPTELICHRLINVDIVEGQTQ